MSNSISKGKTADSQEAAAKLILTADFRVSASRDEKSNAKTAKTATDNVRQLSTGQKETPKPKGANTSSLESTIAELEATIGQQNDEWESDGSGFEEAPAAKAVATKQAQEWVDSGSKEASGTMDDNKTEAEPQTGEESVIDEDMLRAIVADIVRQELQGVLGERITRNVRKLVRREINLVLSTQDFE